MLHSIIFSENRSGHNFQARVRYFPFGLARIGPEHHGCLLYHGCPYTCARTRPPSAITKVHLKQLRNEAARTQLAKFSMFSTVPTGGGDRRLSRKNKNANAQWSANTGKWTRAAKTSRLRPTDGFSALSRAEQLPAGRHDDDEHDQRANQCARNRSSRIAHSHGSNIYRAVCMYQRAFGHFQDSLGKDLYWSTKVSDTPVSEER